MIITLSLQGLPETSEELKSFYDKVLAVESDILELVRLTGPDQEGYTRRTLLRHVTMRS